MDNIKDLSLTLPLRGICVPWTLLEGSSSTLNNE